ncbi:Phosphatidylinositol-specific phospholipase C, Y domain protein [Dictyocaulus viviparus]|uniref:Phosphoinositide phospholipase C n=1 Tax=Dictyocaulus viviparus TaxID=29172 RepID=A0A0D8XT05_DICVI|nr:Phosphatidylinositol-specific phospholipase C, Y domain protein [Dictyocaulus viviparus]
MYHLVAGTIRLVSEPEGRRLDCFSDDKEAYENVSISCYSRQKSPRTSLCKELSELIPSFLHVKTFHDLSSTSSNFSTGNCQQIVANFKETTAFRLIQNYPQEFDWLSKDQIVFVSPDSCRTDSSNLNPQEFWNHGIQLVALNYQTPGLMIDLQKGRFSENGGCGYVLKPATMIEDSVEAREKLPASPQILHLRILSGQQFPRPRGSNVKGDSSDPFVVIEIFGTPSDCAEERTKTVRNDGYNPSFDESFQFQVTVPELALVRFLVLDDEFIGDDFIGQYTIPFECLQPGFRHVPLLNNEGDPLPNATLFVHIAITNKRGGGMVDDQFKTAVVPLCESIIMRNKLETALAEWQEECDLGPAGTIRQGIRLIHTRMMALAMTTPPSSPSLASEKNRIKVDAVSFMIESDDRKSSDIRTENTENLNLVKYY